MSVSFGPIEQFDASLLGKAVIGPQSPLIAIIVLTKKVELEVYFDSSHASTGLDVVP